MMFAVFSMSPSMPLRLLIRADYLNIDALMLIFLSLMPFFIIFSIICSFFSFFFFLSFSFRHGIIECRCFYATIYAMLPLISISSRHCHFFFHFHLRLR